VQPDRLAQEITEHGQIGSVVADVLRGKALNLITERVTVTDDAGKPVDVTAALRPDEADEADGENAEGAEGAAGAGSPEAAAEAAPAADPDQDETAAEQ
jgi:trigger factor